MKKWSIATILIITFLISACNNNSNPIPAAIEDSNVNMQTTDTASNHIATVSTDSLDSRSADFIVKAATGNSMEIMMAKVAMNKAANEALKNISKTIVDQHTELNIKLKDIVQSKNIPFPAGVNESQQNEVDAVTKQPGNNFDATYVNNMIENIKADIEFYKRASTHLEDTELRKYAADALPILLQHLYALQAVKKNL